MCKELNIPFMEKKLMSNNFLFSLTCLIIKEMQIETKMQYLLISGLLYRQDHK